MNSIYLLLSAAVPGFLWLLLIYLTIPYKSTDIKSASKFFVAGAAATSFISVFLLLCPGYYHIELTQDLDIFRMAFARIAPLEESIKIGLFVWIASAIKVKQHPSALLAYGAVLGLGFAVIENIGYAAAYGNGVAITRAFTATVLHVGCGITFAWFYLLSIYHKSWNRNRMDIYFSKHPKIRLYVYQALGLFACVFVHGYYDYILLGKQPFGNAVFLLVLLITTTWGMSRSLQKTNVNNFIL